jgi:hypothetical protein
MAGSLRKLPLVLMALALVGCPVNLLGDREECWPVSESRAAGLWRGVLNIDEVRGKARDA